jgi:hypothetical protein
MIPSQPVATQKEKMRQTIRDAQARGYCQQGSTVSDRSTVPHIPVPERIDHMIQAYCKKTF